MSAIKAHEGLETELHPFLRLALYGVNGQVNVPAASSDGDSLTHGGRVTQICVFNTVKLGTSAGSP